MLDMFTYDIVLL